MKNKVCYDVIKRTGEDIKSRAFSIDDFLDVIKTHLISYEMFVTEAKDLPEVVKNAFFNNYTELYNSKDEQLKQYSRKLFESKIGRKGDAPIFNRRLFNFNNKNVPMFDVYINRRTDFLIKPSGGIIHNENKNSEEGMIFIRCYNYRVIHGKNLSEFVDISTKLHADYGLIDSQMRAIPWFLDEWINNSWLHLNETEYTYVMSPLLHHCLKIYDKMLLLSKQKYGYFMPGLLKNAVDASFNDARILMGMNEKYKTINNIFVRVVPSIKIKDINGVTEFSRFFNPYSTDEMSNAYSYTDVVSSGSGKDGRNKISTDDYKQALIAMGLNNFIFTKEENTNNGLFAWVNPAFIPILNEVGLLESDLGTLNNHMIKIDYKTGQYVTALNGKTDPVKMIGPKDKLKRSKKGNQRFKLSNSRTFLYDIDDSITRNVTKGIDNTDYFFHRNVNYMSNSKELSINSYARNALVAFVSSDLELPTVKDMVAMNTDELSKFMFSLRGVSCEGFFNKQFLQQLMVVPRTERLKCLLTETSPEFRYLIENFKEFLNKRIENNDREQFVVRQYMNCECTGKIINGQCKTCNNPRPITGELLNEYWVNFAKEFEYVTIRGLKISEDGIDLNLDYSIRLANSRFKCEELSKLVPVQTAQQDIGYVTHLRLGDIDLANISVPLDGIYFGLGGFKSNTNGIPFTVLRAYNALKGEIKYSSEDCVDKTDLVNEFLNDFKKSIVKTKIFNKETNRYETREIEAWVGIVALSPTEVSQEFSKSRSEEEKNLSKASYAMNNLLGFDELNAEFSKANNIVIRKNDKLYRELTKVAYIYNSVSFMNAVTDFQRSMGHMQMLMTKHIPNVTKLFMNNDKYFDTGLSKKLNYVQMITYDEYNLIIQTHPLFTNPKFENGFFIYASLSEDKQLIQKYGNDGLGNSLRTIYFPKREVLKTMFEVIGDNSIRMTDLLRAFFGVFETLSVSKLSGGRLVSKDGSKQQTYNMVISHVLKAVNNQMFNKEGLVNQITNIAVPRQMSKLLTDIHCPMDIAIQANDYQYKKAVDKILRLRYPEKTEQEFIDGWEVEWSNETREYVTLGWCWLEDVYVEVIRHPIIIAKGNLSIKKMWSTHKANIEYKKMYNRSFTEMHPGTKGIYLYSPFVVAMLEGDTDGDIIFLVVPESIEAHNAMINVFNSIKDWAFFKPNSDNEIFRMIRDTYFVPTMKYLLDEASNLNFKLDKLEIGYSTIGFDDSFAANFEASSNKENIGMLTVSLWYVTYFLDFYLYNFESLSKRYKLPEITKKNKYEILFIFQYLLAQQNGVRAMKDSGHYGKITYESLIKDTSFSDDQPTARELFKELVEEYKQENAKESIEIDFTDSVDKLFMIFDRMFISNQVGHGWGFSRDVDGKVFHYKDSKWSDRDDQVRGWYDRTGYHDPLFLDFESSFILINGRNYKTFINKFSYEDLLKTLSFKNKPHLTNPLLSYYYDIFTK